MINQTFHKLTGAVLFIALTAVTASPAKAETDPNSTLISQLRGHNTYLKEEQLILSDYEIGRVRGAVGGILSVEFFEPVTVGNRTIRRTQVVGGAQPGDDVIFKVEDDKLVFVSAAKPTWISRLNIKDEGNFVSNRAEIWKELERSQEVGLPPLAPETRTFVAEPEPVTAPAVEAPIRGLW
ncbi:hypothetical protein C7H19_22805 [Aphanothece hegewaldii CCALA 016]|uniref:Uncharacterized protein n=1 Tax=Aphanothece hegewaldii CCALA 016 TaxID=2107694 RepID=A0A2T1LRJ8_9CHRO|nr:hypothetical protein [Aphanothece hegewaldii]PSF31328.1 hypothetical protein C7H19_22805 [Aphanothece hegewaldii CCALA 016]